MNKSKQFSFLVLGILFVTFSLCAFLLPIKQDFVFQISFVFVFIAFGVGFAMCEIVIGNKTTLAWKFLGFPILYVSFFYLFVQIINFVVLINISTITAEIVWLVNLLILAFAAICLIAAYFGRGTVADIDTEIAKKTSFCNLVLLEVEIINLRITDPELKKEVSKLIETIKYSDPVSNENLLDIEKEIKKMIFNLKDVIATNKEIAKKYASEISLLFEQRNKCCKALKNNRGI